MTIKEKPIPVDIVNYLKYEPITGQIIWVDTVTKNMRHLLNTSAGTVDITTGYLRIGFKGAIYKAHRIAWFLYLGEQPPNDIDHFNGNKLDNSWDNLREASISQNQQNRGKNSNNTSGYKGVTWHKSSGKWLVRIGTSNNRVQLGYFNTPELAHEAYCKAADEYHKEFANYG